MGTPRVRERSRSGDDTTVEARPRRSQARSTSRRPPFTQCSTPGPDGAPWTPERRRSSSVGRPRDAEGSASSAADVVHRGHDRTHADRAPSRRAPPHRTPPHRPAGTRRPPPRRRGRRTRRRPVAPGCLPLRRRRAHEARRPRRRDRARPGRRARPDRTPDHGRPRVDGPGRGGHGRSRSRRRPRALDRRPDRRHRQLRPGPGVLVRLDRGRGGRDGRRRRGARPRRGPRVRRGRHRRVPGRPTDAVRLGTGTGRHRAHELPGAAGPRAARRDRRVRPAPGPDPGLPAPPQHRERRAQPGARRRRWSDVTLGFATHPWDVAAGALVLERAGGRFRGFRHGVPTDRAVDAEDYVAVGAGDPHERLVTRVAALSATVTRAG